MGDYLSQPDKTKHSEDGNLNGIHFGATTMQGWRQSQEDAHIAKLDLGDGNSLFAVFDGHGGDEVAKYAEKHLANKLLSLESYKIGDYKTALKKVNLDIDQDMLAILKSKIEARKTYDENPDPEDFSQSGCTSNVILITKDKIYCSNAGDSRAVMSKKGEVIALSHDHKPDNEGEKARIEKAEGFVQMGRTNGTISLSRALGDFDFKKSSHLPAEEQQITADPDISEFDRADVDFIVQACDGIWDCLTNEKAIERFGSSLKEGKLKEVEIVNSVLDEIIAEDTSMGVGCDNMTCILINLNKK